MTEEALTLSKDERTSQETGTSTNSRVQDIQSRRKFALAVLEQLHQDFAALGKTRQAKPLLQELMTLAREARPRSGAFL